MYRVAFLEAEHWHVLGHMAAIKTFDNVEVVAMSGNGQFTKNLSSEMGIPLYGNYMELLDNERIWILSISSAFIKRRLQL